jgi:hypothetical protein
MDRPGGLSYYFLHAGSLAFLGFLQSIVFGGAAGVSLV